MLQEILVKHAVAILVSAIPIGIIASLAFQWIKKQRIKVDEMSPALKNGAVALIATILAGVAAFTGVDIQCVAGENCLYALDETTVRAIIEATIAFGAAKVTHVAVKAKKRKK